MVYAQETLPPVMKPPAQRRSRERVEKILKTAMALIAANGSDDLKMSEIAKLAGIPIGSVYQFFPQKAAIIRTLAERHHADCRLCVESALKGVVDADSLATAYGTLIRNYYQLLLEEPVTRDISFAMQTDPQLHAFELEECRQCSILLADAIAQVYPAIPLQRAKSKALMLWSLGKSAAQLALGQPPAEGQAIIRLYKEMAQRELKFE